MGFETKTIRIAMNGITGRMGYRQHLLRSILPIRDAGGFTLEDGTKVQVEPILVGRNEAKIRELAELHKVAEWTTDLDSVINDPTVDIIFDASMTSLRAATLKKAMLRRQAHLHREAHGRNPRRGHRTGPHREGSRRDRRRCARQAVPPGPGQAAPPG